MPGMLVGRASEAAHVIDLLPGTPLLTLVGAAGVGKTRLAEQVAADVSDEFPDGIRTVDLTGIDADDHVEEATVSALGFRTLRAAIDDLSDASALLLFDNCEHLAGPVGDIVDAVLGTCADVRVLATSRTPLEVAGELVVPVRPLEPDDALELLRVRAREAGADAMDDPASTAALLRLTERVDALPLAIELAAIRLRSSSPQDVVDALDDGIGLLKRGRRDHRHGSVSTAISWSYELLDDDTADAFRRLAILPPPFDFDRAHVVISGGGGGRDRTIEALDRLVSQSLVSTRLVNGEVRYRLLETIRQFARRELERAGDLEATRERYVDHVDTTAQRLVARAVERWTDDVIADNLHTAPDVLAALRMCIDHDADGARACRIFLPGWGLVHEVHAGELARLGAEVMAKWTPESTPGWGDVAAITATGSNRIARFDDALSQARAALDAGGLVAEPVARRAIAMVLQHRGRFDEALVEVRAALAASRALGLTPWEAELQVFEATVLAQLGEMHAALETAQNARAANRELASAPVATWSLTQEAYILADVDPERSAALTAVVEQEVSPSQVRFIVARHLGILAIKRGELDRAAVWLRSALRTSLAASEGPHTWAALRWIAVVGMRCDCGADALAAQLFSITETAPHTPAPGALELVVLDGAVAEAADRIVPIAADPPVALAFDILDLVDEHADGVAWSAGRSEVSTGANDESAGAAEHGPDASLVRNGEIWAIEWRNEHAELPSTKGIVDLAELIRRQGSEVAATELMGSGVDEAAIDDSIDESAKRSYEERLRELQTEIQEAEDFNDVSRAERAQAEFDQIVDQLTGAFGLAGRQRTTGGSASKARSAVTWRIRAAIKKIDQHMPGLGRHLRASVKTGAWCSYDPEQRVGWRLD